MSTVAEFPRTVASQHRYHHAVQTEPLFSASRWLLLITLLAGPLAFGAVLPWAWGLIVAAAAVSLLLWGLGCVRQGVVRITWTPFYIPAIVLLALPLLQLAIGSSLDRIGTREAAIKFAGYFIIFFLIRQLLSGRSSHTWRQLAWVISAFAFLMAVFAITQSFTTPGLVYGTFQSSSNASFGTYINHTNYAGLMEMLIPISAGLWLGFSRGHQWKLFLGFAILVSVVSVFLSGSRAGVIAIAVEVLLFGIVFYVLSASGRSSVLAVVAIIALAVAAFLVLDTGAVRNRWQQLGDKPEVAMGNRLQIARDALHVFADHPVLGVGMGAFEIAYTPYQTVITEHAVDFAHNDYLQLLAETGILGFAAAIAALVMFFWLMIRRVPEMLDSPIGLIQLGAAIGICGILVNSFSDFNLHIPANAAWFTALAALVSLPGSPEGRRAR